MSSLFAQTFLEKMKIKKQLNKNMFVSEQF